MPAIVLASDSGAHLGFLLLAGDQPVASGPASRDCVLMGPPKYPNGFEHPLVDLIYSELHKEREVVVQREDEVCVLRVSISPASELRLTLPDAGKGTWVLQQGQHSHRGVCHHVKSPTV